MGNDVSQIPSIKIEEEAVALSDFWNQHSGQVISSDNVTKISVLLCERSRSTSTCQAPLQINIKVPLIEYKL